MNIGHAVHSQHFTEALCVCINFFFYLILSVSILLLSLCVFFYYRLRRIRKQWPISSVLIAKKRQQQQEKKTLDPIKKTAALGFFHKVFSFLYRV